jgi:glutathione S-transferase
MPLLTVGDASVGQSGAINFYLATEFGLMGSSTLEAAQILSISEHIKEMMAVFRTVVPYGQEPTEEALEKWFNSGATDRTGPADGASRSSRYLMWWMGRIEETLGSNGFAVGTKLSLADVLIYETFSEFLKDEEAGSLPSFRRECFCSKAKTDALLAKYPKLQASSMAVASNANLQKWLSIRGPQAF